MAYSSATNAPEAKFCLPYCLAVAVCDGQAGLKQFTHERVGDARVQALAARVRVVHPDGKSEWETGTRWPCTVRIRCNDGSVIEESVGPPRGDLENPLSMDDILEKYRQCTHGLLSEEHATTIPTSINRLESLDDFRVVADIVTFGIWIKPSSELK
jgi:2-methylcitrate dehydratase PrpD